MTNSKYIIRRVLFGILITGALVGASVAIPLFQTASQGINEVTAVTAQAKAASFAHRFDAYRGVAQQFTSRTEIRLRLEKYLHGEWDLNELVHFNEPRLGDALSQSDEAYGLIRFARDQSVTAQIGLAADPDLVEVDYELTPGQTRTGVAMVDDTPMLQIQAPIFDASKQLIGVDVVFFCLDEVAQMLADEATFGAYAKQWLVHWSADLILEADGADAVQTARDIDLRLHSEDAGSVGAGMLSPTLNPAQRVRFYAPMDGGDWGLVVELPEHSLYQPAYFELAWAALAVVLLMILGSMVTSRTIGPLVKQLGEKNHALREQAAELKLAASVFEGTHEPIIITDMQQKILRVNKAFCNLTGYQANEVAGRFLSEFLCTTEKNLEPYQQIDQINRHLQMHDSWQGELNYDRVGLGPMPALQTVSVVKDANNHARRLIHIFNDITQEKAARRHMKHQAEHDALTGLANRLALIECLENLIEEQHDAAVLFVDLDRFKQINDNHGHQVGDELLRQVAQRLQEQLRDTDIVGRMGGDEFLVLLDGKADINAARTVSRHLVDALTAPFEVEGNEFTVGCSIGVALFPEHGAYADTLIKKADKAMYEAKAAGGNDFSVTQDGDG